VWEQNQDEVKPFVEKMGDKMAYRVALDAVPESGKGEDGAMAKSWMKAAGQNGIPTAFIVGGEGKIYWIGHPMQMDEPLEKIASGSWDVKTAIAEKRRAEEEKERLGKLQGKLIQATRSGDSKQVIASADEIIEVNPKMEVFVGPMKLAALIKLDEQDKALEYGKRLLASDLSKEAQGLNSLAWTIVDPDAKTKPSSKLIQLAVESAKKADELAKEKDAAIADTLAKAYFDSGEISKAVETQERAVKLSKGTPYEQDSGMKDRLEQYKKAVKP
jgi:tetratricopeptide (TPR) repeat protein